MLNLEDFEKKYVIRHYFGKKTLNITLWTLDENKEIDKPIWYIWNKDITKLIVDGTLSPSNILENITTYVREQILPTL